MAQEQPRRRLVRLERLSQTLGVEDAVERHRRPQTGRPHRRERDGRPATQAPAQRAAARRVDVRPRLRAPQRRQRAFREDGRVLQLFARPRGPGRVPAAAPRVAVEVRDDRGVARRDEALGHPLDEAVAWARGRVEEDDARSRRRVGGRKRRAVERHRPVVGAVDAVREALDARRFTVREARVARA